MLPLISTGKHTIHGVEDATSSEHFDLSLHYEITQSHLFVTKGHCGAIFFS